MPSSMAGMAGMADNANSMASNSSTTVREWSGMTMGTTLQYYPGGKIGHPMHGGFNGHVLPGCFFLVWGSWWLFSCYR